jgi:hypothetical protein
VNDLCSRLELPGPDSLQLVDTDVSRLYREFVATLAETPDRSAIRCESTFFDFGEHGPDQSSADEIHLTRLKLLAALLQPGPRLIANVREKTFDVDQAALERGQYSGYVYDFEIRRALEVFGSYPLSPDGRRFQRDVGEDNSLLSLRSMVSTAPGLNWFQEVDVRPFSRHWAVVLHYSDTEDVQYTAFPKVLGFVSRERLVRSVAAILANERYYWIHASEEVTISSCNETEAFLLTFCWSQDEDCEYGGGGSGLGRYPGSTHLNRGWDRGW